MDWLPYNHEICLQSAGIFLQFKTSGALKQRMKENVIFAATGSSYTHASRIKKCRELLKYLQEEAM